MTDIIRVTDHTTRAEMAEILALANAEAKAISRCGMSAMLRPEYADVHLTIDALLEDLLGAA